MALKYVCRIEVSKLIKILFVCHGNVCRSPMAEYVFKDLVKREGNEPIFFISSAATHDEVLGQHVHPPAAKQLAKHGINCSEKTACLLKESDGEQFDLIIGMEQKNRDDVIKICGEGISNKVFLLLDFTNQPHDIIDPFYTHDYEKTWDEITQGCRAFLQWLNMNYVK